VAASKFTEVTRTALIDRFAAGVSIRDACRALDIREGTVKGWITRGHRESDGPYAEFLTAVEVARRNADDQRPMDEAELRQVAAAAARKGSVQAMKLVWELLRSDDEGGCDAPDPFDDLEAWGR
jgi:hypothetical protein